ncbi:prepilin peptidase [Virgibacillus soli]|uniref:Prepilin peptidase n=1 Tax=Paracerasibacillus soli TaxID=480284 RepID=A0ABU5CQB1_9BACI|nr:prepilin peptidase [Virgibacillus soli]MDY0408519.1 prepilin peptidase [Virgibacillus soli]
MYGQFIILALFLAFVCYFDIRYHRIPNWLNVSGFFIGIIYHVIVNQLNGFLDAMLGSLAGGGILLLLYVFKAIGAGDVKLFAAIGAICGVLFTLYGIMYSIIFAGIIGIVILLLTKTFLVNMTLVFIHMKESLQKKSLTPLDDFKNNISNRFPFIYAVIPGIVTSFYYMYLA